MNKTAAVIVTYNRKKMLLECVDCIRGQTGASADILIVDNASTDGTREALQESIQAGTLLYFNTGKNIGGAGGFSYGMKKAVELGYTYIWAMDDDTFAERDALSTLLAADKKLDGKYGFLSSIAYWTDGGICNMNRQRTSLREKLTDFSAGEKPVIMATFVGFWVKTETVRKYGLPIADFFIWSDDLEYSRRISRKEKCYAVTGSRVVHNMASNAKVGIEQDSEDRLWRYAYMYRNEVYLYKREGIKGILYLFLRVVLHSVRVLRSSGEGKGIKLKTIWKSFFSGFRFSPVIQYVGE